MQAATASFDDVIDRGAAGFFPAFETTQAAAKDAVQISFLELDEIDDELRGQWRELAVAAATLNPYFSPQFLEPAMRNLGPSHEVKLCLLRLGETGLLVALAPVIFQVDGSKQHLKHACVWSSQRGLDGAPLIRDGFDVAVYAGLIDWIDNRPEGACILRFSMQSFNRATQLALEEACDLRARRSVETLGDKKTVWSARNPLAQIDVLAKRTAF